MLFRCLFAIVPKIPHRVKSLSRVLLPITLFAAIVGIASHRMPRDVTRRDREQGATREAARNEAWERREWMRERFGGELNQDFARRVLTEAAKERAKHPEHFRDTSGGLANPLPGADEVWRNLGPTSSNKIQNFFTLDKVNSGRLRRILPHPTDPNTVYVLSAGGGLWKTTNFMDAQPTWFPKTDFIGSTTGGGVAFGQSPTTLYLGTGDPFDVGVGGFVVTSTDGGDTWSAPVALGSATKYSISRWTRQWATPCWPEPTRDSSGRATAGSASRMSARPSRVSRSGVCCAPAPAGWRRRRRRTRLATTWPRPC